MIKHMLCTHCGYDMVGPEYIASTVDASLSPAGPIYSNNMLLEVSSRSNHEIICPNCQSVGSWTT